MLNGIDNKKITSPGERRVYLANNIFLDIKQQRIYHDQRIYSLTKKEFQLLYTLLQFRGKAVDARELLNSVWADQYDVSLGNLYVYIRRLREKLETNPNTPEILVTCKGENGGFMIRPFDNKFIVP